MPEAGNYIRFLFSPVDSGSGNFVPIKNNSRINGEQAVHIEELKKVNDELRQARRAALNLMEDAILSKEALQKSEEKYRTLFNSIDDGFCIIEMIFDDASEATDFRYIETNPAFVKHVGQSMLSKRVKEVVHDFEPFWLDRYGHAAKTGEPVQMEGVVHGLDNKWFQTSAFRLGGEGSNQVAVIFRNITQRKQQEERQQYLLQLSDVLRTFSNSDEVLREALKMVGEYLDLDRVTYNEIDPNVTEYTVRANYLRESFPSNIGRYPMDPFKESVKNLHLGQTFIVYNANDEQFNEAERAICRSMNVGAYVTVPLVKNGRWVCNLVAHYSKPRNWSKHEIALLEETADRTWTAVEKVKAEEALRKSEVLLARELEDTKKLQKISSRIIEEGDADELYEALIDSAIDIMHSDCASIQILGPGMEELSLFAWKGFHTDSANHWKVVDIASTSSCGQAFRLRKRIVVPDVNDPRFEVREKDLDAYHLSEIVAMQTTPLISRSGNFVGMLSTHWKQAHQSSERELGLLEVLARQAADLIERKQAEDALRENEQQLQVLIQNLPGSAVFIVDPDLRYLVAEGEALHRAGFKPVDYIGKTVSEVVLPGSVEKHTILYRKALNGETFIVEHDEYKGSFVTRGVPLRNANGDIYAALAISHDISDRKKAEGALQKSEVRFRTLADAVPQVIWTNTADGKADYFNQRWYEYTGLNYEQSVGPGWQAIVHPDDKPASVEKWNQALAAGKIFDTEYRLRGRNGTYCWFIGRNVPLKDETGKVIGWFGSATDIEDLKKTAEALSQSEARLRITMESATDYAIITMDAQRRVERWSSGATQIFGYTEAEMIGQSADAIFTEEDREAGAPQAEMETARDTVRAADERWHRRKDNSRFYASGVMRSIQNNKLPGYVKVLQDMTQQKLSTEELHRLVAERTAELRRSNEDLAQFAHVASHDLREPVRKIKTFNNRIIDDFSNVLPEKVKMYLNKIENSTDRMFSMIEGVLNYSKVGNIQQPVEAVDLNKIIREIESDLEVLIQQKKAQISVNNLPVLMGYRVLLYQLFYNLILNSLKFAKAGEPSLIHITCQLVNQDEENKYKIILSDNGIGFEQEHANSIFGTFTRLNSADDYEGTGLGLALCKKIVDRHRGSISASGELENGATFSILLPVE